MKSMGSGWENLKIQLVLKGLKIRNTKLNCNVSLAIYLFKQIRLPEVNKTALLANVTKALECNSSLSLLLKNGKRQKATQNIISLLSLVNTYAFEEGPGEAESNQV